VAPNAATASITVRLIIRTLTPGDFAKVSHSAHASAIVAAAIVRASGIRRDFR
jgi:hypothetical protein